MGRGTQGVSSSYEQSGDVVSITEANVYRLKTASPEGHAA